jgi:alkylhydroperoxidase family enzyme
MSRIRPLELHEMTPEVRVRVEKQEAAGLVGVPRIQAHQPAMALAQDALGQAVMRQGTLPPRLFELIRLRIAFHNQCRSCMSIRYAYAVDNGFDEGLVCSLEKPAEAADLTMAERSALRFADLFATNHLAIDDAVYDDLRQYYTEQELVELGYLCAISVGFGRLAATWDVVDHLSERFQDQQAVIAPWDVQNATVVGGRSKRSVLQATSPGQVETH